MRLRPCPCLAQDFTTVATSELFARVSKAPAVQSLARCLEKGGVLSCNGISAAAQSFYRHLSSPAATKVFQKYGFTVLSKIKAAPEGTK